MRIPNSVLYVLYQDKGESWRIQAVPASLGSFQSRKKLPLEWNGLRDKELSDKAGIQGCIFVHATGFIGGNESKEGALLMAQRALEV